MRNFRFGTGSLTLCVFVLLMTVAQAKDSKPLLLHTRRQEPTQPPTAKTGVAVATSPDFRPVQTVASWDPKQTAIVVCDMWDKHWCPASTERVGEMAPRMNEVLKAARARGVTIIHCPSDTLDFYKDTPQRKRAQAAPVVETKIPLQRWCRIDGMKEAPLPIDDTDGGCDCENPGSHKAWSRQHPALEIFPEDAITDSAEAYYLMRQQGITNVIVMGVHTNMCVLGRPFSIRQLVQQGQNVVLMRDLTDTMYNPAKAPYVNHFTGTDLVVEHIEKYWCPTITSVDLIGGVPLKFKADTRPQLTMVIAEDEYQTERTLPQWSRKNLWTSFRVSYVFADPNDKFSLPEIGQLDQADVALFSVRRRPLPVAQLDVVRRYVASGKPLVAIRTSSHAFALRDGAVPEGLAVWPEFDQQALGCHYAGHLGKKADGPSTIVRVLPEAVKSRLLEGISQSEFGSPSWLYKSVPLAEGATPLLMGRFDNEEQPVAWTWLRPSKGRTFYTSLGHPGDFEIPAFERLLLNGTAWAADLKPVP